MQKLNIRNSTAEFLIFTKQNKEKTIEVIVERANHKKEHMGLTNWLVYLFRHDLIKL